MVYYESVALSDLSNILTGLISWKKHPLSPEHARAYVRDIRAVCNSLDKKIIHHNVTYSAHRHYGEKVHLYRRNKQTVWNIVYDIDLFGNVLVNKIISNHLVS